MKINEIHLNPENPRIIKDEKLKWYTEKRIVNKLIPYEHNPRQMTEKQVEDLKKSLEKFNLVEIPAIDIDNRIIAGHQRLKILQMLERGNEEIEVRIPNRKLTDEEFQEYNLRSNKNLGEWDWDILADFDEEMLLEIGFEKEELIENYGINEIESMIVPEDRAMCITVYPPESPILKEKKIFYCEEIEEYEKIVKYFETDKEGSLDILKLLGMIK
jgi:hypothetical protein